MRPSPAGRRPSRVLRGVHGGAHLGGSEGPALLLAALQQAGHVVVHEVEDHVDGALLKYRKGGGGGCKRAESSDKAARASTGSACRPEPGCRQERRRGVAWWGGAEGPVAAARHSP